MSQSLLTATQVCAKIDVSVVTLTNWYKWWNDLEYYKPPHLPKLPDILYLEKKGKQRFWREEDVIILSMFKSCIGVGRNGLMGDFNAKSWQSRGKRALQNKGREDLITKYWKENDE